MPDFTGYLGGDADTFAIRSAHTADLRLAIDVHDRNRMLLVVLDQDGELTVTWSALHGEIDKVTSFGISLDALEKAMGEPITNPPHLRLIT